APCANVRSTLYASPPPRTWLMYGWELMIVISPSNPATGPRAYREGRSAKARRDRAALARPVVKMSSWAPMYLTMPAWRAPWTAWRARAPRDVIIAACPSPHTKRRRVIDGVLIRSVLLASVVSPMLVPVVPPRGGWPLVRRPREPASLSRSC